MPFPKRVPELDRNAFLGKAAQDLLNLSSAQVAVVYAQRGLVVPVEVTSTLLYLHRTDRAVLTELAEALEIPHQLAAQRVAKLTRLEFLEKRADPVDNRRAYLQLTRAGRDQARILEACMADVAVVYKRLYAEIDCDLPAKLHQAIDALKQRDLASRFEEVFHGRTE